MKPVYRFLIITTAAASLSFSNTACHADEQFPLEGAQLAGTTATAAREGLHVSFGTRDAWPNINWKAPGDKGWDWSSYEALVFDLINPGNENVPFHVKINDIGKDGKGRATQLSGMVRAGQSGRYHVSLQPRSMREKSLMRVLPPLEGDYGTLLGTGVEPDRVTAMQIFRSNPKTPATLIIKSITLEGKAAAADLTGIIDEYGQYNRKDWPGKIKSNADFAAAKAAEEADLRANPGVTGRSKWGGWLNGPRQKATGYFRTAQVDGRWWMVDPEGYLFLSVGIDVVRPDIGPTAVGGRETMFTWLPNATDPLSKFYGQVGTRKSYSFLMANLQRKYGTADEKVFADFAVRRHKSWGFNTFGNWTKDHFGREQQFPYVAGAATRGGFATIPGHKGHLVPDPWDPAFARDVEAQLRVRTEAVGNDPACVGYFFDNELGWGMPSVDNEHYVLAWGTLAQGPNSLAKQAFIRMLQERYATIDEVNTNWGTKLASWEEFAAPLKLEARVHSAGQRKDFSDYLSLHADKYFETVSSTMKRLAPNHLYLGSRFAFWYTEEAVRSCAKYADVISFNIYNWNPASFKFTQNLGKPSIVGEFHFGATDRGMFTGNITVKSQEERGERYAEYVRSVLSEPNFIGVHWFQYYDQPVTGRGQDGENFNIGFLSITDTPYTELIAAARKANAEIYTIHAQADR